jgi:hypothetical protein
VEGCHGQQPLDRIRPTSNAGSDFDAMFAEKTIVAVPRCCNLARKGSSTFALAPALSILRFEFVLTVR